MAGFIRISNSNHQWNLMGYQAVIISIGFKLVKPPTQSNQPACIQGVKTPEFHRPNGQPTDGIATGLSSEILIPLTGHHSQPHIRRWHKLL